ncbi:MAG: tic20-like family protein [Frankiales bacterium]|nr:tic20-like family protein [Frankiales bacterium]
MTQPGYAYQAPPEDTVLSVLVHLSLFAFQLLGPLVVFLIVKDDPTKPMTRHHSLEALNFHISLFLYAIVSLALILVIVGFFMLIALAITSVVLAIIAAVAAGNREPYRYPMTLRLIT